MEKNGCSGNENLLKLGVLATVDVDRCDIQRRTKVLMQRWSCFGPCLSFFLSGETNSHLDRCSMGRSFFLGKSCFAMSHAQISY